MRADINRPRLGEHRERAGRGEAEDGKRSRRGEERGRTGDRLTSRQMAVKSRLGEALWSGDRSRRRCLGDLPLLLAVNRQTESAVRGLQQPGPQSRHPYSRHTGGGERRGGVCQRRIPSLALGLRSAVLTSPAHAPTTHTQAWYTDRQTDTYVGGASRVAPRPGITAN